MSTLQKRSRTTPRLRRMGWMSLVLSIVLYLAGSNIGSGWIVLLAAALVSAPLLDLMTAWSVHRRTAVDARPVGPRRVGASRLALDVDRPHSLTAFRMSAGSPNTRAVTRQSTARLEGPMSLRRGIHEQVAVTGETVGPLGLAFTRSTWSFETHMVIGPATVACPDRVRRLTDGLDDDLRRRARRDDEIQGVRPFVQGDPQRLVNWRATARHGEMMVREHTRSGGGGTFDITITDGLWDHGAMDLACTLANSIATGAARDGHHVTLRVDGRSIDWSEASSDTLATLPPASSVTARPLAPAPSTPAASGLQLSCDDDALLLTRPGAAPVRLGDMEAVRSWLLA